MKATVERAHVDRVFETKHGTWGAAVYETYTPKDGPERKSWVTLWFKEKPDIEPGDVISASGFASSRGRMVTPDEGEAFPVADVSLNGARLIEHISAPAASAPDAEPWEQPGERF
ncbi:hypothetical protein [Humibacter sp. RRB41]|uniref:hypothetical protein n=1 Tax=Humibacter sp. RRB41 TaxID=2919946 RepID=UPI001FAA364C|nr:hypothetical protein [Humibacter sp. RRB41]